MGENIFEVKLLLTLLIDNFSVNLLYIDSPKCTIKNKFMSFSFYPTLKEVQEQRKRRHQRRTIHRR